MRRPKSIGGYIPNIAKESSVSTIPPPGGTVTPENHRRHELREGRGRINKYINYVRGLPTNTVTMGDDTMDTRISKVESSINRMNHNMYIIMNMLL